jgi:hypothetical protein
MLLDTRALILQGAHLAADATTDMKALRQRIAGPNSPYSAVICCYTATGIEREEIVAITTRSRITMLQLHCLVRPSTLIAQVSDLLAGSIGDGSR